ncbi:MAG: hypothetical protein K2N14_04125, partial [Clostridia bacterium]|nr:hypothetical protein [Clostridia bacterium]
MKNFFTSKSLGGIYPDIENDLRLGAPTAVFGVADSQKYLTASVIERPVLYIAPDPVTAGKAFTSICTLSGKRCAHLTAKDDVLTYKTAVSKDALFRRIEGIVGLLSGAEIIVCDAEAAMQLLPSTLAGIRLEVGAEYDYAALPSYLVQMGYVREYTVENRGTFAVRGDILDIFPVTGENPVRVDFFGDTVERIRPYDFVSGERLPDEQSVTLVSATDCFIEDGERDRLVSELRRAAKQCKTDAAFKRLHTICGEIEIRLSDGTPFAGQDFLFPLLGCARTLFDLLPADTVVVLDECKSISDRVKAVCKEHAERLSELIAGGEACAFSDRQQLSEEEFCNGINKFQNLGLQTFTTDLRLFRPLKTYNMRATPCPAYLNNVPALCGDIKHWLSGGYRVLLYAGGVQRYEKLTQALNDEYIGVNPVPHTLSALKDVAVSSDYLEKGFILHEAKLAVIGSGDMFTKPVTKRIRKRRGDMFSAPEIGDFAVHEKHGVGKITGTKKIETTDGIKEYVAIEYRGGDVLYVPVEQMDTLSKYVGDGNPTLSKIGGAEFEKVKERVRASIKKLAFDLKKLYAERGERRGYCFPENAVMMQEFEDAFQYEETPDQLTCIEEIKQDMCSEKVMDRLLCGDV